MSVARDCGLATRESTAMKAEIHFSPNSLEMGIISWAETIAMRKRAVFDATSGHFLAQISEGTAERLFGVTSDDDIRERVYTMPTERRQRLAYSRFDRAVPAMVRFSRMTAEEKADERANILEAALKLDKTDEHAELYRAAKDAYSERVGRTFAFSRGIQFTVIQSDDLALGVLQVCTKWPMWPVC